MPPSAKPLVILKPAPQLRDRIFREGTLARLKEEFDVLDLEETPSEESFQAALPEAFAIVGHPELPADTIEAAANLRAIINVEGNFFPNVDYAAAFRRGIRVLGCGPAYSQSVAEYALGLALDLARGISREDRAMREGAERWVSESNHDSILLRKANVGFVGYGNLGRALHRLLEPFYNTIRVYDPWLPTSVLEDADLLPSPLEETLAHSQFVFVFATATAENLHFLNEEALDLLSPGARLILVSRANILDYEALLERVAQGKIFAAIDVWPTEPLPVDSPFRDQENTVLSAHRAGGIPEAFYNIGDMVCDDLQLLKAGLPPSRLQIAAPELVTRYRNKPVS